MLDAIKPLLDSDLVNEETRSEIAEQWEAKINETRNQVTAELREEFAQRYEHDKSTMVEALDRMVTEGLTTEIAAIAEERKAITEDRAKFVARMQESSGTFDQFLVKTLSEEIKELKSETRPRDLVAQMSGGQRQAVAIARTRLSDPKIVLMDEPTAAISVRQVAEVLARIKQLKDTGHAVILVSHRMPDVFEVCDRVAVLRRGSKVADKAISQTSPEEITGLITGALEAA